MKKYKVYNIKEIKSIEKKGNKGNLTYWAQIGAQLKRIAQEYFCKLEIDGIKVISISAGIKSNLLKIPKCFGFNKNGLPCKRLLSSGGYCFQHKKQGVFLKEAKKSLKCVGVNRTGFQCNRLVSLSDSYCFQHKNKLKTIGCDLKIVNNFLIENQNKICLLDCLEGLKKIPSASASIIICDPPYNIGKDFGNLSDKQSLKSYLQWCKLWVKECLRVLQYDGLLYIYGFSEILAHVQVSCLELSYVRWVVWHYTNKVSPLSRFWQRSHESILCCSKKKNPYFNVDLVREPYTVAYEKSAGKIRKGTKGRFGSTATVYTVNPLGALPRDVLKIPALSGSFGKKERVQHPTQKPLVLCEKLIKSTLKKGNNFLVVPFVGSGSECVAAERLKIPFIGFEINENYISLANDRLKCDV